MSTTDRPARVTDNLGLPVPGDAGPADYVADTGALADAIDQLEALFFTPGDLRPTGANQARAGWLLCDGAAYIREEYADLFAAIGVAFGAGDGATTFNVPDLRGRAPVGAGAGPGLTNRPLGARAGEEAHALAAGEMPSHAHGVNDPPHAHAINDVPHGHAPAGNNNFVLAQTGVGTHIGINLNGPGQNCGPSTGGGNSAAGGTAGSGTGIGIYGSATGVSIQAAGGNGAHNNMPPFVAINWLIKT